MSPILHFPLELLETIATKADSNTLNALRLTCCEFHNAVSREWIARILK